MYDDEFSFLFLNLNKILKNSTPGKVACIWPIERVQIEAIKFERTQLHFLTDVFTAVVVVLAEGPQYPGTCDTHANEHTVRHPIASYV